MAVIGCGLIGSSVIRAALIRYLYVTTTKAGDKIRRITAR
jgi:hypothetical protein